MRWHRRGVIRSVYGTARGSVARVFRRRHAVLVGVGEQLLFRDDSFFSNVQVRLTVATLLAGHMLAVWHRVDYIRLERTHDFYCSVSRPVLCPHRADAKGKSALVTRVWKARGSAGESHRPRERERSRNSSRWSAAAGTSSRHFKTIICCGVD